MEGLIPLVLKTLKKNSTRRNYKCLSTGKSTFDYSDFYVDNKYDYIVTLPDHRRRNFSTGEYSTGISPSTKAKKQMVRSRSHRFFSCVGGA